MTEYADVRPTIGLVAPSLDILGGQGIQAMALADALRRDGYRVAFIPINPRFPQSARRLRAYPYIRTLFNEALYVSRLGQLRNVDVVHIFSASYWSFLLAPAPAIVAARFLGKPVVLHYHSGEADDHLTRWRRSVAPLLRLVDEIVVPSSYLQTVFASHGYDARVISNVIDVARLPYRERTPLRPSLLSVRNLESHYRVDNTIAAFACLKERFPDATLTLAGYGSQQQELERLGRRLAVSGIRFLGRVDPDALGAVYDSADIFVNSSVIDNQPVSILEAFACGLPVVSTPTGDIPSMVRGGEAGLLVDADSPRAMADAITRLLEDPDLALRVARSGREEVDRYSWHHVREQWVSLYDNLVRSAAETSSVSPARRTRVGSPPHTPL